ncbi:unnamed protein product [Spirodela intermedia]|uniref:Uncharacterized protein n=2 Tax=Spirodela intermedia TaxID=51605 RepID=A0A7I8IS03_SPIIN|nr:unnamed protein product [Spirodela intermedia]CAA6660786.1 unnamed protein product [Spirodela intermedia]CAA7397138.1 unnamed protein product [Spirodela intermedia]
MLGDSPPNVWAYLGKSLDRCTLSQLLRLSLGHLCLGRCLIYGPAHLAVSRFFRWVMMTV